MEKIIRHGITIALMIVQLGFANSSFAHELQPGLLEVRQLSSDRYAISWRAPTYFNKPHPAKLQLPGDWQTIGKPSVQRLTNSNLHGRVVRVPSGDIKGSTIRLVGLESTITDVFARVYWLDGSKTTAIAGPDQPYVTILGQRTMWRVFADYIVLGVDHILSGFDHLTFVLVLLLIVVGWQKLLITVTSFTVAHSITLAAATMGILWVPGPPVEAVIALSIMFVAGELAKVNQGGVSLTSSYPWVVAFVFGLLHGFGFAGALNDIGLPENEIPIALLSFNIGVELGQLMFVAGVLTGIVLLKRTRISWPDWCFHLPAYAIGSIAAFWLIQRISLF